MEDNEIIGGFEALFGAMSPEQEARINAYLAARVGPSKPAPEKSNVRCLTMPNVPRTSTAAWTESAGTEMGVEWECSCGGRHRIRLSWSDLRDIAAGRTPPDFSPDNTYAMPYRCCKAPCSLGIGRRTAEAWLRHYGQAESQPAQNTMPSSLAVAHYIDHLSEWPICVAQAIVRAAGRNMMVGGSLATPMSPAEGAHIVADFLRVVSDPEAIAVVAKALDAAMAKAGVKPPKALPSADDVVAWMNAQGGELPDAVVKAIASAIARHTRSIRPFPPPYDFLRDIPPLPMQPVSPESWRHLEDWFRKNRLPEEPHGFGKQWVGTTTGDSSIAQQPPTTQTIGEFVVPARTPLCLGASLDASDDRLSGIPAPYSDDVGPVGGVFR